MLREVLYATTHDGTELPIVDVTHPAFTVTATDAELQAMTEKFVVDSREWQQRMTPQVREAIAHSMLGHGIAAAAGTYLPGINTYLLKIGPGNLGPNATPIDHSIAAGLPAFCMRLRLQDMARLLADGLAPVLAANPERPLQLINIAGGPASDSWNALIHLANERPEMLGGRDVLIAVLDLDEHGPAFGARALASLRCDGAPLSGLEVGYNHIAYNWAETGKLQQTLSGLRALDAVCAVSSEGGLFEYGSDEEIVANLEVLHAGTPAEAVVVGSVTRGGEAQTTLRGSNAPALRPRTIEGFQSLAERAGWALQTFLQRPFSYNVRLVKA